MGRSLGTKVFLCAYQIAVAVADVTKMTKHTITRGTAMTTTPLFPGFKESLGLEFPPPIVVIVEVEPVPSVVLEFPPPVVLIVEVEPVPPVVLVLKIVTSKYGIMVTRSADKSVASIIRDNVESTTIMVEL